MIESHSSYAVFKKAHSLNYFGADHTAVHGSLDPRRIWKTAEPGAGQGFNLFTNCYTGTLLTPDFSLNQMR